MEWILVLLIVTRDGQLTASQGEKPVTLDRCEAIGLAQQVRLAEDNRSAQYVCVSLAGTKPPARKRAKPT